MANLTAGFTSLHSCVVVSLKYSNNCLLFHKRLPIADAALPLTQFSALLYSILNDFISSSSEDVTLVILIQLKAFTLLVDSKIMQKLQ